MNTCDTCQWFEPEDKNPEFGECKHPMIVINFAYLDMREDGIYLHPGHSDEGSLPIMGGKFGCIHHLKAP